MGSKSDKAPYWIILFVSKEWVDVYFQHLPLTGQSECPIEAAQAAVRSVDHRCRGAGACPGHGSLHSCALQSNFDPSERQKGTRSLIKELRGRNVSIPLQQG